MSIACSGLANCAWGQGARCATGTTEQFSYGKQSQHQVRATRRAEAREKKDRLILQLQEDKIALSYEICELKRRLGEAVVSVTVGTNVDESFLESCRLDTKHHIKMEGTGKQDTSSGNWKHRLEEKLDTIAAFTLMHWQVICESLQSRPFLAEAVLEMLGSDTTDPQVGAVRSASLNPLAEEFMLVKTSVGHRASTWEPLQRRGIIMEKSVVFEDTAVSVDLDFKGEKEAVSKHCSVAAHRDPPCTSSEQATTSSQDRLADGHKNSKDETHQAEKVTLDAPHALEEEMTLYQQARVDQDSEKKRIWRGRTRGVEASKQNKKGSSSSKMLDSENPVGPWATNPSSF